MPITFCIWAAENNSKNQLRLFLWLKFLFPGGKFKNDKDTVEQISAAINYKSNKSTISNINALIKLKWLVLNTKTDFVIIKSIERIREENNWHHRMAVITYPDFLKNIQGLIGAAIFAWLYENIKRKEKEGSLALSKGGAYTNFPSSSKNANYKPIALTGLIEIFNNFNIAKASRLKTQAQKSGLILVKKNYLNLNLGIDHFKIMKNLFKNIVIKNENLCLQQIDTILPLIIVRRRKKL